MTYCTRTAGKCTLLLHKTTREENWPLGRSTIETENTINTNAQFTAIPFISDGWISRKLTHIGQARNRTAQKLCVLGPLHQEWSCTVAVHSSCDGLRVPGLVIRRSSPCQENAGVFALLPMRFDKLVTSEFEDLGVPLFTDHSEIRQSSLMLGILLLTQRGRYLCWPGTPKAARPGSCPLGSLQLTWQVFFTCFFPKS